uniref:NADH dehydrogenase subunit 5 n=1 Tax=Amblyomma papuanum TaxID=3065601 RepID=UPI0030FEC179
MFIKWSMMLFFFSFLFFNFFLISFYFKNLILIEYYLSSILTMDFKFFFIFDWISNLFISVVLLISSMVILYSDGYMKTDKNKLCFCLIVLMFVMSMVLLILMPSMFMLILGWDGLGLVSYCLVIYYQSTNSYNSGMMTIISNRVGDVMVIMSLIFFINFGSFDIMSNFLIEELCGLFIIVAGMTKSAQIPFSAWLPAAMAAPTPVSSLVHSSTLVTAGVYILIRFNYLFSIETFSMFLLKVALVTMVMSGINAFFETDFKKIIAFSTLSQLSMMMVMISLNLMEFAFFHLIMHAIFKSMLFLCAGLVIHSLSGIQDIRMLSNFFWSNPFIVSCMLISIFSLIGFPFIGGFYSKDLIVEIFVFKMNNAILLLMFIIGLLTTFLYSLRMIYYLALKGVFSISFYKKEFEVEMTISIFILTFLLTICGNFLYWLLILNFKIIYINFMSKIMSLILMTFCFFSLHCFFFLKKNSNLENPTNLEFFHKMWFMSSLTSMIFFKKMNNFYFMMNYDWKWLENLGPMKLNKILLNYSLMNSWINKNSFSKFIVIIFMLAFIII